MKAENFEKHLRQIKEFGGRPAICGQGLTDSQIVEIARAIFMGINTSTQLDVEYFINSVLVRRFNP